MKPPNPGIRVATEPSGSASLEGSLSLCLPITSFPSPTHPITSVEEREAASSFSVAEPKIPPPLPTHRAKLPSRTAAGLVTEPQGRGSLHTCTHNAHAHTHTRCVYIQTLCANKFACLDLFMRPRHNWLASLHTSAPPPTSPNPHCTSKETRTVTTNSSC